MALGVLLAGSVLASGGMVFAQDGPIGASDRRVQDEQDDLELSARGSGRLAEDQQALDSTMDGRILGPAGPAPGAPSHGGRAPGRGTAASRRGRPPPRARRSGGTPTAG